MPLLVLFFAQSCATTDTSELPSWLREGLLQQGQIYTFVVEANGLDRQNALPAVARGITETIRAILAEEAGELILDDELLGDYFQEVQSKLNLSLRVENLSELLPALFLVDEYAQQGEPFGTFYFYLRFNVSLFLELMDLESLLKANTFGNQEILELTGEQALQRLLAGFEEAYAMLENPESFDDERFQSLLNDIELILTSLRITLSPQSVIRELRDPEASVFQYSLSFGNSASPVPGAPVQVSSRVMGDAGRPLVSGLALTSDFQGQGSFSLPGSGIPGLERIRVLLNLSGRIPRLLSADRRYHQRVYALEALLIRKSAQAQILNHTQYTDQTWSLTLDMITENSEIPLEDIFQDVFAQEMAQHGFGGLEANEEAAQIAISVSVRQTQANSGAGFSAVLEGQLQLSGTSIAAVNLVRQASGRSESSAQEAVDLGVRALAVDLVNEIRLVLR